VFRDGTAGVARPADERRGRCDPMAVFVIRDARIQLIVPFTSVVSG
jgi:hypothetical protein